MFDDQPLNNANTQVPSNLPIGDVEDVFSDTEKMETPMEDFPEVDSPAVANSALGAGVLRPKQTENPPLASAYTQPAYNVMPKEAAQINSENYGPAQTYALKEPRIGKWILYAVVGLGLVGLALAGFWAYNKYIVNGENTKETQPAVTANNDTGDVDANVTAPVDSNEPAGSAMEDISSLIEDDQVLFGEPIDNDGDGLDDVREKEINTDSKNWDTDNDQLGDGDEVLIWKTNPLNPDSDGDGYKDGEEVKNGYNPAGPGKIFEPPTTTANLQ